MFLRYGVNENSELIYIDQVPRGKTSLMCPYCGGLLTARKGEIKVHHFAHTGETCRQVERDDETIALPFYDGFNLHLTGKEWQTLRQFHDTGTLGRLGYDWLENLEAIKYNSFTDKYELTHSGKIPFGELSLMLFNQFQEPLLLQKHEQLERAAINARATADFETRLADLRLYRAQMRRILSATLYFLEIEHPSSIFHKIGVTTRDIKERLIEISYDVAKHFPNAKITVLDTFAHRGNIELYFKHRYAKHQFPIGTLTEYFDLSAVKKEVLLDIHRMKAKTPNQLEWDIINGSLSPMEQDIYAGQVEQKRRIRIKHGMKIAAKKGVRVGRPTEVESVEQFLSKPKNQEIAHHLKLKLTLRAIAKLTGTSVNTVRKVKPLLDADEIEEREGDE